MAKNESSNTVLDRPHAVQRQKTCVLTKSILINKSFLLDFLQKFGLNDIIVVALSNETTFAIEVEKEIGNVTEKQLSIEIAHLRL
ncbi:hypothetical protein BpHYR1_022823 [Brachionus plicatilis]|uniref:Uncharacterized protein n=1 Tax=Brachionus plicatilis TaxID=10195 RepID=A0A3M7QPA1_BRAPC|nr:hypothetical protein BpHYR1_022823 [Brachionus plicatilis]